MAKKHLEVVLKTVERCNINCSYCYFFNANDNSYLFHPAFISHETIIQLAIFLKQASLDRGYLSISIIFHGGEPLLQKKKDFSFMCETLIRELEPYTKVYFVIQTNAMLINDEWLELFIKYDVNVGVSIDGSKNYHDLYRKDHRGRGTHDRVVQGIKKLNQFCDAGKLSPIGALAVINPEFSPKKIYRYFVDTLNIKNINFLLPDLNYDNNLNTSAINQYGQFLVSLFNEWAYDNDPSIKIEFFNRIIDCFIGRDSIINDISFDNENDLIVIRSDGEITLHDALKGLVPTLFKFSYNIKTISLVDFLNSTEMKVFRSHIEVTPTNCKNCCWFPLCKGGNPVHRYKTEFYFKQPSIMCEALKSIYARICAYLIDNDVPIEKLGNSLGLTFSGQ